MAGVTGAAPTVAAAAPAPTAAAGAPAAVTTGGASATTTTTGPNAPAPLTAPASTTPPSTTPTGTTPTGTTTTTTTPSPTTTTTTSGTPNLGGLIVGLVANVSGWGGAGTAPRMQQVVSQTGTKWLREEFLWATLEPTAGNFDFSYYDHFMQVAAEQGEHILPVVDDPPAWASPSWDTIPADPSAYASLIAQLAARYGPRGTFWAQNPTLDRASAITTFELWNEPYFSSNYDPPAYANLVKAAATAGRAANPATRYLLSAEITGRQIGSTWLSWIDALYQAMPDLNNYFDAVAIHPYGSDLTGLSGIGSNQMRRTELLRAAFVGHGAADKPLWITEVGWPTCTSGSVRCTTEAGQLASLQQLTIYIHTTWSSYIQAAFIYHYTDNGTDRTNPENDYGLTTYDYQAKPALAAFQSFAATSALTTP
jgi:hypothetical protein